MAPLDPSLLLPPLVAGALVLSTHVPLGRQVLARGIIFIDLAVAQVAGLGVIAAQTLGWASHGWEVQISAACAALLAALLLNWTERHWPDIQEALIGGLFVLAASSALLLLAGNPHGGEHFNELLAGQILWVTWHDLIPFAALSAIVLGLWVGFHRRLGRWFFYTLFAVAVTGSVQLVGVYLVFSSLIFPALVVHGLQGRKALALGFGIGGVGYLFGLVGSGLTDLPSGPAVVCALALVSTIAGWGKKRFLGHGERESGYNTLESRDLPGR